MEQIFEVNRNINRRYLFNLNLHKTNPVVLEKKNITPKFLRVVDKIYHQSQFITTPPSPQFVIFSEKTIPLTLLLTQ